MRAKINQSPSGNTVSSYFWTFIKEHPVVQFSLFEVNQHFSGGEGCVEKCTIRLNSVPLSFSWSLTEPGNTPQWIKCPKLQVLASFILLLLFVASFC